MYQGGTDRTGQGKKMGVSKYAGVSTYVCMLGFVGEGDSFFQERDVLNQNPIPIGWGGVKFGPL